MEEKKYKIVSIKNDLNTIICSSNGWSWKELTDMENASMRHAQAFLKHDTKNSYAYLASARFYDEEDNVAGLYIFDFPITESMENQIIKIFTNCLFNSIHNHRRWSM